MVKDGSYWFCTDCDYKSNKVTNVKGHIESKHIVHAGYSCDFCGKICPTQEAMRKHKSAYKHY